jgi:hypothetical protein
MRRSPLRKSAAVLLVSFSIGLPALPASADEPPVEPADPPAPPYAADVRLPPPGYHYENKRYIAPIIVGASALGVGWLASSALGALGMIASLNDISTEPRTNWATNYIPVVGPFVTLGGQPESQRRDGMTAALVALGTVQIAGLGVLIGGLAAGKREVLVRDRRPRSDLSFSVQPVFSPTTNGVLIGGSF